MHLVRHNEVASGYAQFLAEQLLVPRHMLRVVTTVMSGIERGIGTYTNASSTLGAEGDNIG